MPKRRRGYGDYPMRPKKKSKSSRQRGPAGAQVAAISELMEMILLDLPLKEVLIAQRVSKDFRSAVRDSYKLQKALFFKPIDKTVLRPVSKQPAPPTCTSSEVCRANSTKNNWSIHEQQDAATTWCHQTPKSDEISRKTTLNPFIYTLNVPWLDLINRYQNGRSKPEYQRTDRILRRSVDLSDSSWREASLSKMQVFQPPASEVWLHCPKFFPSNDENSTSFEPHWHSVRAREGHIGVTVGEIKEHADRFGGRAELIIPSGTKFLYQWGPGRQYVVPPGLYGTMGLRANSSRVVYELLEPHTEHVVAPPAPFRPGYRSNRISCWRR